MTKLINVINIVTIVILIVTVFKLYEGEELRKEVEVRLAAFEERNDL